MRRALVIAACAAVVYGGVALPASAWDGSSPRLGTVTTSSVTLDLGGAPMVITPSVPCPARDNFGDVIVDAVAMLVDSPAPDGLVNDGNYHEGEVAGYTETDATGAWSDLIVQPSIAHVLHGQWFGRKAVATGPGHIQVFCLARTRQSMPGGGSWVGTYAPVDITVRGAAPRVSVSSKLSGGANVVTVEPSDPCSAEGTSTVDVSVLGVGDNEGETPAGRTVTTRANGTWDPVSLKLPGALLGDYAVAVTCTQNNRVISRYDGDALMLGTVTLTRVDCTPGSGAVASFGGTYTGGLDGSRPIRKGRMKLTGDGPWKVIVQAADRPHEDGAVLFRQAVDCTTPTYTLKVTRTRVSSAGQVRARVCATGTEETTALLQIFRGAKPVTVDDEELEPGDCIWLQGGRIRPGGDAQAQVISAPDGALRQVSAFFALHRDDD